jgi:copper homeostasis protein
MTLEICAYSVESCINAQQAGANRVELCGGMGEGGTTPSYGTIALAREKTTIPIYVMIRPRGGDFVYTEDELESMRRDIDMAKQLKVAGVVIGILLPDGTVDVATSKELIERAKPLGVTFHRAFDLTPDPVKALEDVIEAGAERILTSGQQANVTLGADLIGKLTELAGDRIEIMAGAGVGPDNVKLLKGKGVKVFHFTAKDFRPGLQQYFPEGIPMAGEQPDEHTVMFSSPKRVQELLALLNS